MSDLRGNKQLQTTAVAVPAKMDVRTFADFLEDCGPDVTYEISDLLARSSTTGHISLRTPLIKLHCESDACSGIRQFSCGQTYSILSDIEYKFVTYVCRNCGKRRKIFALAVAGDRGTLSGQVQKLGEIPPFGPPTPSRVMKLVGQDRELFLKGRRAELRGLGIGAFAYYRRVVEEQKGRIIEEIGKVAGKLKLSNETAELFVRAQTETQFSKAIETIKAAIPESLLIGGHNPLTLLHNALSEGLHAQTDEECLELASSIRVVLTELAERISVALKEEAELKTAVNRLLSRNAV